MRDSYDQDMADNCFKKILKSRVYDIAIETPTELAKRLSSRLKNKVLLKREDLQPVFSFKIRGAYNKMATLDQAQLKKGVIAASAGNHAQGVALSAKHLGCKATIVMPKNTTQIKIDAVKDLRATVILKGDVYDEAENHARELALKKGVIEL